MRKLAVLILAAAVAALVVYGFLPRPVPVDTAKAGRGRLVVTVDEEGKTRVIDRYTVSAPIAGYLERVRLDEGDRVEKGETLAKLEPLRPEALDPRARANAMAKVDAASAALNKAGQDVRSAEAAAGYAGADLGRKRRLYEKGVIALDELQSAETESRRADALLGSARFAVEVARHELESARTALRYSPAGGSSPPSETVEVRSPVEGRVLRIFQKSEGALREGGAIIEIGDPGAIEVEVDVLSGDAVKIRPGMRVLFTRWGGEQPLEGMVRVVEPSGFTKVSALGVEEQRVWVISVITSPRGLWERLGDGYRVEASFIVWEGEDVLQAPESALFRHGGGWAVFRALDGRAVLTGVETGRSNGISTEIVSGLKDGDEVITHPDRSIGDGSKVKPRGE